MERLQGDKHFSELLLPISRFILKNSIFAQLFLNNIMRMYHYHENEWIMWQHHFAQTFSFSTSV